MTTKSKSALYYAKNKKARDKKKKYDAKLNSSKKQINKRVECNRARRKAKASGKNISGKDASHTKKGIVFKKSSTNRGSKSDSAGDRKARGGGKRRKKK